ncbi:3498_t:CDS:1, partial [Dentiscutata erythropus]
NLVGIRIWSGYEFCLVGKRIWSGYEFGLEANLIRNWLQNEFGWKMNLVGKQNWLRYEI